jgi:hypothetical protein
VTEQPTDQTQQPTDTDREQTGADRRAQSGPRELLRELLNHAEELVLLAIPGVFLIAAWLRSAPAPPGLTGWAIPAGALLLAAFFAVVHG